MAVVTIQFHCVEKGSLEILNFMQESQTDSVEGSLRVSTVNYVSIKRFFIFR